MLLGGVRGAVKQFARWPELSQSWKVLTLHEFSGAFIFTRRLGDRVADRSSSYSSHDQGAGAVQHIDVSGAVPAKDENTGCEKAMSPNRA